MIRIRGPVVSISICTLIFTLTLIGHAAEDAAPSLPPPSSETVSYLKDVKPILQRSCVQCHNAKLQMGDLLLTSREAVLKGGAKGAVVKPGDSENSRLIHLVAGTDPELAMPLSGTRLTPEEVGVLRAWIDQGLVWDDDSAQEEWMPQLAPRRPELPAASDTAIVNPIDRLLQPYYEEHGVDSGAAVDDRLLIRRMYLDVVGLLPPPDETRAFIASDAPDKVEALAGQLLDRNEAYADHWLAFWNDLLRNEYRGTGFIDDGRRQITHWLRQSLVENKPYDHMVSELIDPVTGSEGFIKGIVWRGAVNASQTPEMQAAQNISQSFLGINLKCASCHDSFINHWKLKDSYGMAAIFSEKPLEIVRCDSPTGRMAEVKFLYSELGSIDANAPVKDRRRQLAELLVSKENGRFSRTIVNRLWDRFFGHGLVEPIDDMDARPWSPDALDWLASDLADHDYDLKRTIKWIVTSRAYRRPAVDRSSDRQYVFTGPLVRRMSAEQFVDSIAEISGIEPPPPDFFFQRDGRGQGGQAPESFTHKMVRYSSGRLASGTATVEADVSNAAWIQLAGTDNLDGRLPAKAAWIDATLSGPAGTLPLTALNYTRATTADGAAPAIKPGRIETHTRSTIAYPIPPGYDRFTATVSLDQTPVVDGRTRFEAQFYVFAGDPGIRASLLPIDPLQKALSRPSREQVATRRDSLATTLQALELSNGDTLFDAIENGARNLMREHPDSNQTLVDNLFWSALSRAPEDFETGVANELMKSESPREGVEDLLWIVTMLPEFQLVY
ncbi:MAG: DUF1553 domain-containing protein [bacterium]|nr:DUF1553 domain-containing protein [bacterium]